MLLASRVSGLQRTQTLAMFAVGLAGLLYIAERRNPQRWTRPWSTNQALLEMLTAVSFLRLISLPGWMPAPTRAPAACGAPCSGCISSASVINLSAVMILGDPPVAPRTDDAAAGGRAVARFRAGLALVAVLCPR